MLTADGIRKFRYITRHF